MIGWFLDVKHVNWIQKLQKTRNGQRHALRACFKFDNLVIQDTTYELSEVLYKESNNPHVYFINSKCWYQ